ncbi:MAG: biotin/lipoyl-binding protein [Gemmatimonadales bacterium]|nr:MAG: biotin/lipoyl-binding protein [Gemmatimonadales bacterium]
MMICPHGSLLRPMALAATLTVLAGCGDEDAPAPSPPAPVVAAWTVSSQEMETERRWTGRLAPLRTLAVQAPREGRVDGLVVEEGDGVERGAPLLSLVTPDLRARLQVLRQRRDQLEEELARWEGLAAQGAAGPGEVAAARLRLMDARESLVEAEALDRSQEIQAPASGAVHGIRVSQGSTVERGDLLLQVDDDSAWGVTLAVAAWEASRIANLAALSARDSEGVELEVARVSLAAGIHDGFFQAEIRLLNTGRPPRGVDIIHRETRAALLVPWTAVAGERDSQWVGLLVPSDGTEFHTVERRDVVLGDAWPEGVEVLEGLAEGDRVLRYEPRSHPEGRRVRIPGESDPASADQSSREDGSGDQPSQPYPSDGQPWETR